METSDRVDGVVEQRPPDQQGGGCVAEPGACAGQDATSPLAAPSPAPQPLLPPPPPLDYVVDAFIGSDGSRYYGTLRNGVPSGLGTCIWPSHCHYDGEWRGGLMNGFGTYVWSNGQRYDGEWKVC
jgi:MORN repeat